MSRYPIVQSTLAVFAVAAAFGICASRASAQTVAEGSVAASLKVEQRTTEQAATEQPRTQLVQPLGPGQTSAPVVITLKDALEHAQKVDPSLAAAGADAKSAHEDSLQARNALLPNFAATSQYLNTQGNGATPDGRFVTNDGVHVYRDWGYFAAGPLARQLNEDGIPPRDGSGSFGSRKSMKSRGAA